MPPISGKNLINYRSGLNADIISTIHKNFAEARRMTVDVAKELKGADAYDSAYNVWRFLKNNIKYAADPSSLQMVRMPNRLVASGTGDCKSYSLFTAAVLSNMGYPVGFRYASYSTSPIPSHVYVFTKDENGKEIIIDAVWNGPFNTQKPYTHKKDYIMQIATLSGVYGPRRDKRKAKRAAKAEKRGGAKGVKRYALAGPRNAFLALIRLNARSVATNLQKQIDKNPDKVKSWWNKLGGDFNKLKSATAKGSKKRRLGGFDDQYAVAVNGIGEAVTAASLLAAAAPIVIAVTKFLKQNGAGDADTSSLAEEAGSALEETGQEALPDNLDNIRTADSEGGFLSSTGGKIALGAGVLALAYFATKGKKSK